MIAVRPRPAPRRTPSWLKPDASATRWLEEFARAVRSSTRAAPCANAQAVAARVAADAIPRPRAHGAIQYPTSTTSLAGSWRGKPRLPTRRSPSSTVNWAAPAAQRAGAPSRTHHSASARV